MPYAPYQQRRIDAGMCLRCPQPVVDGKRHCPNCARKNYATTNVGLRKRRQEWKADPCACNVCGAVKPEDRFSLCERCREKARVERQQQYASMVQRKKEAGICTACTRPSEGESRYCRVHLVDAHLRRSAVPKHLHAEVWAILEQQEFRCYYSGQLLVPGRNLSLDHKIPVSVDPSLADDVTNLVWCTSSVNSFKSAFTDEAFIRLCKVIAQRFPD